MADTRLQQSNEEATGDQLGCTQGELSVLEFRG